MVSVSITRDSGIWAWSVCTPHSLLTVPNVTSYWPRASEPTTHWDVGVDWKSECCLTVNQLHIEMPVLTERVNVVWQTALHELFHALGFSADLFPSFQHCTLIGSASNILCGRYFVGSRSYLWQRIILLSWMVNFDDISCTIEKKCYMKYCRSHWVNMSALADLLVNWIWHFLSRIAVLCT